MTTGPVRALVVDDDALVRGGLSAILGSHPDIRVVGEAGDGATAVSLAVAERPDVVLMDVRMPGLDGIEATRLLTERLPDTRVVVVTTFEHDSFVFDALVAGARAFVLKRARPEELLAVVLTVASTDALVFPDQIRDLARQRRASAPSASWAGRLTDRELEVLTLAARGHSNAEIGAALFIGVETVKTHVRSLLAKSGARDRTGLVVAAYEGGVIRPGDAT